MTEAYQYQFEQSESLLLRGLRIKSKVRGRSILMVILGGLPYLYFVSMGIFSLFYGVWVQALFWAIIGFIYFFSGSWLRKRAIRKRVKSSAGRFGIWQCSFDEEGYRLKNQLGETRLLWSAVTEIALDREVMIFLHRSNIFSPFPLSIFPDSSSTDMTLKWAESKGVKISRLGN